MRIALTSLLFVIVTGIAALSWRFRDIPAEYIEAKYGLDATYSRRR
jgi:hypothetical protein